MGEMVCAGRGRAILREIPGSRRIVFFDQLKRTSLTLFGSRELPVSDIGAQVFVEFETADPNIRDARLTTASLE